MLDPCGCNHTCLSAERVANLFFFPFFSLNSFSRILQGSLVSCAGTHLRRHALTSNVCLEWDPWKSCPTPTFFRRRVLAFSVFRVWDPWKSCSTPIFFRHRVLTFSVFRPCNLLGRVAPPKFSQTPRPHFQRPKNIENLYKRSEEYQFIESGMTQE